MPTDPTPHAPGTNASTSPCPVAFVITRGDSVGGAQIHVRDLAARLVADQVPVVVLVGSAGPFTDALAARGVRWHLCPGLARSINPLRDIRAVRELHRALLIERPCLVSTHTAKAGLVGRLAACWAGIPVLFTAHGWQFAPGIPPAQRALVYALEMILSRLPQPGHRPGVITVSRFDLRLARRTAAVPARRLRLVYNGLPDLPAPAGPTTTSNATVTKATKATNAVPTLVMIARFQQQKDHAGLIRALEQVPGPWVVQLVGEAGPRFDTARDLARSFGFLDDPPPGTAPGSAPRRVEFLGHRDDIPEILAAADIYCLITNWEGLPRSIIEAMRAGLPIVATDVGGVRELVSDNVTGFLVPPRDHHAIADRLSTLLQNPSERARLGRHARLRYETLFTFEAMYHHTLGLWRHLGVSTPTTTVPPSR